MKPLLSRAPRLPPVTPLLGRQAFLRRGLPLLGVCIVGLIWLGAYLLLRVDRDRTEEQAMLKVEGSTQAYEAQLQRNLQQISQLTAFVANNAELLGTRIDLNRLVRQTLANQPALRSLFVTDASGTAVAVALDDTPVASYASVADRPYFRVHRDGHPTPVYVGEPILGRVSGRWVVHVSRARVHPDGSFAGVVVATLDPESLSAFYNPAQFGQDGLVGVAGLDGVIRSRRSGERIGVGERIDAQVLAERIGSTGTRTLSATSTVDGVTRYMAYRLMPEFRLVAYTGLARDEALAAFHVRRDKLLLFVGGATLLIFLAFVVFSRLVVRLLDSESKAARSADRFEAASHAQLDPFFILSAVRDSTGTVLDFRCDHVNQRAAHWLELPRSSLEGSSGLALVPVQLRDRLFAAYCSVVASREPIVEEFSMKSERGKLMHVIQQVVPVDDGLAVTVRDVTAVRNKEVEILTSRAALAASEERLRAVTDNVPVLIAYLDAGMVVRFVNATYERWFGVAAENVEGRSLAGIWPVTVYQAYLPHVTRALAGVSVEFLSERETQMGIKTLQNTYTPDFDVHGAVRGIYMMSADVTDFKNTQAELSALLHTDTLTGLANRRSFNERLPQAIARAQRHRKGLALLYLDVDRFKSINDTHGHPVGDEVLRQVAARLRQAVRVSDTVARLSGDEFVVILEDVHSPQEAGLVAAKVVSLFKSPFELDGARLGVTVSMGVVYDAEGRLTGRALLEQADAALYSVKGAGRNDFAVVNAAV